MTIKDLNYLLRKIVLTELEEILLYNWYWESNYTQHATTQEYRLRVARKLNM